MKIFENVAAMAQAKLIAGQLVSTKGYYAAGDGGQADYLISTPQTANVKIESTKSARIASRKSDVTTAPTITSNNFNGFDSYKTLAVNSSKILSGSGSPEGVVVGNRGDVYLNILGGAGNTLWAKETDSGLNTGWSAL